MLGDEAGGALPSDAPMPDHATAPLPPASPVPAPPLPSADHGASPPAAGAAEHEASPPVTVEADAYELVENSPAASTTRFADEAAASVPTLTDRGPDAASPDGEVAHMQAVVSGDEDERELEVGADNTGPSPTTLPDAPMVVGPSEVLPEASTVPSTPTLLADAPASAASHSEAHFPKPAEKGFQELAATPRPCLDLDRRAALFARMRFLQLLDKKDNPLIVHSAIDVQGFD